MEPKDRIILALDTSDPYRALQLVDLFEPHVGLFKVGLELIYSSFGALLSGSEWEKSEKEKWAVQCLFDRLIGRCFWDPKFHDTLNTVKGASRALVQRLKPVMFTVHASGGKKIMRKAVEEKGDSLALAVTILSSHTDKDVDEIFGGTAEEKVALWAKQAWEVGMDGVVCSPKEIRVVKSLSLPSGFLVVTPGSRLLGDSADDQARVMTPREAIEAGADYLVLGRVATHFPRDRGGPLVATKLFLQEIEEGMRNRQ